MHGNINASDFALAGTLSSGQAFRWRLQPDGAFIGVVGDRVWRLRQDGATVWWESDPAGDHEEVNGLIQRYLRLDTDLMMVAATFPGDDAGLQEAVRRHWGLRILRQEPWECLASFIASSTKQIVQIRQIVELLAQQHGNRLATRWGVFHTFPAADVVARLTERELRSCKLGFRAKYLATAAHMIADGAVRLEALPFMAYPDALAVLLRVPGVGEKIANCVLLFSCGFDAAFPVDVWIERALRRMYFPPDGKGNARERRAFTRNHFGPYAGWAQQYLFCDERRRGLRPPVEQVMPSSVP